MYGFLNEYSKIFQPRKYNSSNFTYDKTHISVLSYSNLNRALYRINRIKQPYLSIDKLGHVKLI